jgi:hypothetical protein
VSEDLRAALEEAESELQAAYRKVWPLREAYAEVTPPAALPSRPRRTCHTRHLRARVFAFLNTNKEKPSASTHRTSWVRACWPLLHVEQPWPFPRCSGEAKRWTQNREGRVPWISTSLAEARDQPEEL